ncbi:hypothetical protein [Polaromonas sp. YR568]|uniref:hypothetical protein n=1 Tax=Polaromonas sp. YR568 TaxID=1855301 RepID=UPI00398BFB30
MTVTSSFGRIAAQASAAACAAVILVLSNLDTLTSFLRMSGDDILNVLLWILFVGAIAGGAAMRELPQGKRLGSLGGVFFLINGGVFLSYAVYALLLSFGQK